MYRIGNIVINIIITDRQVWLFWNTLKYQITMLYGGGGTLVAKSWPTLAIPWTEAHQAPLSKGFPRQEYGSGLPFPSPTTLYTYN